MSAQPLSVHELADQCGLALLYHGTFASPPAVLGQALHNVAPETLFRHLEALSRSYRFVSVDEYCQASNRKGLATVTVDDGYQCVPDEAFRVFEALQIPLAIFINGAFMKGTLFWRDQVRVIMERGRTQAFETRFGKALQRDPGQSFYRYTKDPRNSSIRVCEMLDAFLEDEAPIEGCAGFYTQQTQELIAHPLVCYGSHSLHHYVLSSLNEDEQWREIDENRRFLETLPHVQKTSVFSIPFGGDRDYNDATVRLAAEAGHSAMLLSRGVVQGGSVQLDGRLPMIDRVMPRDVKVAELILDLQARFNPSGH